MVEVQKRGIPNKAATRKSRGPRIFQRPINNTKHRITPCLRVIGLIFVCHSVSSPARSFIIQDPQAAQLLDLEIADRDTVEVSGHVIAHPVARCVSVAQ